MLRPIVWTPAVVALLALALLAMLESAWFAGRAKSWAEDRATRYLDRPVEIGALSIDVVPLSVEAERVVVGAEGPADGPPFAEVDKVQLDARFHSWLRPGITLERLRLQKPIFRLSVDPTGRHDAPRPVRRARTGPRRFEVEIGVLEVVEGVVELDDRRYPLVVSARDVNADLVGGDRNLELAGRARASDVSIVLPGARPYFASVSAHGSYRPGRLEIARATLDGPELRANARGSWEWREPRRGRLAIEASGSGRLLDRLGYAPGLVRGPFEYSGDLVREEGDWSLAGRLSSPGVVVAERSLAALSGRLLVDDTGANYRVESGRYAGGGLTGSVRLALGSSAGPVELDLAVEGADLNTLLLDQGIPVSGVSSSATGTVAYQFPRGSPERGNGWAELALTPRLSEGRLAFGGSAAFSIGQGLLQTQAVRLLAPEHLVLMTGDYDIPSSSGSFDFDVSTQAVEEVLALLPAIDQDSLWRPRLGRGSLEGSIAVTRGEVEVSTEVDLTDVEAPGYSANLLQGRFAIDRNGVDDLRLELLRPEGGLILTGTVPVAAESSELALAVDAEGWPLDQLGPWLPFDLPVTGDFSGSATIDGALRALRGSARGRVSSPRFEGLAARRLDLDLGFSPERLVVHEAELGLGAGAARLRGSYDFGSERMALSIESDRLQLGELAELGALSSAPRGTVQVEGEIAGTASRPEVALELRLEDVGGGSESGLSSSGALDLGLKGSELTASGSLGALLQLDGGGVVEDGRAELTFDVASQDVGSLVALLAAESAPRIESRASGRLVVAGRLGGAGDLSARLELDHLGVEQSADSTVTLEPLENLEPVVLTLDERGLGVDSLYLGTAKGTSEIFVFGRVGMAETGALDLKVQASVEAGWFEPWLPEGVELTEGRFDAIGALRGTRSEPDFDGLGELARGRLVSTGFPARFEELEAVLLFYPGEVVVDRLRSEGLGGRVEGAGTVHWSASGISDYRLQLSGDRLSFRYPEGWSMQGDAEITLSSNAVGRQLGGTLRLDRALYVTDVPIELDQLLRSFFEQRRLEVVETDEILSTTQLNLAVEAESTMRIRNNLADLRGSADLVLRGSLARPVVFGTVELEPSGRLSYAGTQYEIERGVLTFANPYRLEPVIDLVARTDLREYDVTLSLSGTPDRLSFDFISDPPLAELEVMALLTGGRRPTSSNLDPTRLRRGGEADQVGAEEFLYGQATSLVASRFNRLFGLDQFRIDPLTGSTGDLSSARITVGKRLSRDLFATYSYDPAETEEQIFELEWSVSRSLLLVVTQNGDGTYAVDAKWEKAF